MGSEMLFHIGDISITAMKRHSDILILQKQIKQQITVCTLQSCVVQLTRTGPKSR